MCDNPRLCEQIYAQWRAEQAARRAMTRGMHRGVFARFCEPAVAAPAALLILLVFLAI